MSDMTTMTGINVMTGMIASIGANLPQDLLAATGRYRGRLGWNIDRPTPRADQWLESKFAPWTRSILEDWVDGAFDHLAAIVFTRGDDSVQRLYYYACELRARGLIAGPEPLIFDVAHSARPSSLAHTIASVRALAGRLDVSDAALEGGIIAGNVRRGSAANAAREPGCLLSGTLPPDHRVHALIEAAGWRATGETLGESWQRLGAPVDQGTDDPAAAIGRQLFAERFGPRAFFDRGAALKARVQAANACAAVLWYAEEDEVSVWHLPQDRRTLETLGIPVLALTRCDWRATDGIDAQITNFLKDLPQ